MARSKSSRRWMDRHVHDPHVQKSQQDGYRSRAVYKLIELDQREKLLQPGQIVLELGAAPGGWTQYIAAKLGEKGRIVATDILPMDALPGVEFIQGDFNEADVAATLEAAVAPGADLVLSDMAPNITGVSAIDQPAVTGLAELALVTAVNVLKTDGALVVKLFQGEGFDPLLAEFRRHFQQVRQRKPDASRAASREVYVVARNLIP